VVVVVVVGVVIVMVVVELGCTTSTPHPPTLPGVVGVPLPLFPLGVATLSPKSTLYSPFLPPPPFTD